MTSKEIAQCWFNYISRSYNQYEEEYKILKNEHEIINKDLLKIEYLETIIYKWIDNKIANFENILSITKSYYIDGALQMLKELKMILYLNLKSVK